MQLSAVLLARAIGFVDINDFNPVGKLFFPQIVPLLRERFGFTKFPTKPEDFDESKGVVFEDGYFNGESVQNITVYSDGIKIDVRSSTENAQTILRDTLAWLSSETGLTFNARMMNRWAFVSQITFFSDVDLDSLHPALAILGERLSSIIGQRVGQRRNFKTTGIGVNFERLEGKINMGGFSIERRESTSFHEQKYFSGAPLETADHLKLIEEFERNVFANQL